MSKFRVAKAKWIKTKVAKTKFSLQLCFHKSANRSAPRHPPEPAVPRRPPLLSGASSLDMHHLHLLAPTRGHLVQREPPHQRAARQRPPPERPLLPPCRPLPRRRHRGPGRSRHILRGGETTGRAAPRHRRRHRGVDVHAQQQNGLVGARRGAEAQKPRERQRRGLRRRTAARSSLLLHCRRWRRHNGRLHPQVQAIQRSSVPRAFVGGADPRSRMRIPAIPNARTVRNSAIALSKINRSEHAIAL